MGDDTSANPRGGRPDKPKRLYSFVSDSDSHTEHSVEGTVGTGGSLQSGTEHFLENNTGDEDLSLVWKGPLSIPNGTGTIDSRVHRDNEFANSNKRDVTYTDGLPDRDRGVGGREQARRTRRAWIRRSP